MTAMVAGKYQNGHLIVGTVYRVVRHIGTGGMGSLYEVEDTTVGRHYVLKTLHPELIEREDLAVRMQQEARALGRLSHPNIVEVITAGVTGDALKMPFYVMERLVGRNLRTVIEATKADGGIGAAQAYRICIDVASALQHAHENAMVHRDVKPENIFLHRGRNETETKLLDFGIVRMLNREATLTRGKFLGTLKYSSPEQITGLRDVGPASDIYSLALVLYELLAGRGPFDDAGDAFKVGAAHAGEAPPPPSRFRAAIAPEVERLLLHALQKQPEARPASAGFFAAELRRALKELQAVPSVKTDLDLLNVRATVENAGPPIASSVSTVTSPEVASTVPDSPPVAAVVTRIEGGGHVAIADTVAAPKTPRMEGAPAPATPEPVPGGINRDAPTRISAPSEPRVIVAPNDTQIGTSPKATLKMAQPLVAPPAAAPAAAPVPASASALAEPPRPAQQFISTVHTRPRKDRAVIALVAAAFVALAMIAGAFVLVRGRLTATK